MILEKITSPLSILSDVQYKFCVPEEYEKQEEKSKKRRELSVSKSVYMIDERTYAYKYPFCKKCFSRDVNEYGYNSKMLIDEYGTEHDILVQRYICKSCGKLSHVEFHGEYESYCNFSNKTKNKSVKNMELDRVSLRNTSKMHKNFNNMEISHETVRKSGLILDETYFTCDIDEMSGYCGYDEQWVKIDGEKWKYRYVLFDLIYDLPIAEALYDDMKTDTIKEFIESSIPHHKRKLIVTDTRDEYDSLMTQLGFEHQYCSFHLIKNINKKIQEHLNKTKRKIEKKIKKEEPKLSKKQLQAKIEEEIKPLREEINLFKGIVIDLFKKKSYEDAVYYVERMRYILDEFPPFLAKYLKKEFFPKYKKYLTFLKEPHKGKIDSTNNKTENYIGNIMPKADKNKYRTKLGFINQVYHRVKNWIKNQKFQLTN
jgi:transposase-like protein